MRKRESLSLTEWLHALLNHEVAHQWLVFPEFLDGGSPSDALLGRDGAHWSYLLDSEASYMYGSEWTDNGDHSNPEPFLRDFSSRVSPPAKKLRGTW